MQHFMQFCKIEFHPSYHFCERAATVHCLKKIMNAESFCRKKSKKQPDGVKL
jgi:hypothetical protein